MCHMIIWKLFHTWGGVCMESRCLCNSLCAIDQGMVSSLLFSSHWPFSAPNACFITYFSWWNWWQFASFPSLFAICYFKLFHPWQNTFARSSSFTVIVLNFVGTFVTDFVFPTHFQCCLLSHVYLHTCGVISLAYEIDFHDKVSVMRFLFLRHPIVWCHSDIIC